MITCKFEDGGDALLRHITACAILLNKEHDKVLMIRRSGAYLEDGKVGLPGGYMNRDENLFETVKREVTEETGYDSKVLSLFKINDNPIRPNSRERQTVEMIFLCEIGKRIASPDHESSELVWVSLLDLNAPYEFAFDHLDHLKQYQSYQKKAFPLPIFGTI